MKNKFPVYTIFLIISACLLCSFNLSFAQKKVPEPIMLEFEGRELPAVSFSHKTHTEKSKIDCAVCHHKDKNPKEPQGCLKCHPVKDAKDDEPIPAKMAFHKMCISCHKESSAKNVKTPIKCNECHRK